MLFPRRKVIFGMSIWNNMWAVYGVVVDIGTLCPDCTVTSSQRPLSSSTLATFITPPPRSQLSSTTPESLIIDTARSPRPVQITPIATNNATTYPFTLTSTSSPHSTSQPSTSTPLASTVTQAHGLSSEAKIAIGVTVGVLAVALVFLGILEGCYLRRKRREAAMKNAVEEVERGANKGSEERIVLESRVSIVVDEGIFDESGDEEDTRHGMSLPRRA